MIVPCIMKKSNTQKVLHIYLDVCCLNRPFDDQTQDRIRFEAESVIILLKHTASGKIRLIGSDVMRFEINKTPDPVRKSQLTSLAAYMSKFTRLSDKIVNLAYNLQNTGFGSLDSLHIACAELSGADLFVTTDDTIIKLYNKKPGLLRIRIENPVTIVQELLL